jgi:hypothetical protein
MEYLDQIKWTILSYLYTNHELERNVKDGLREKIHVAAE